MLLEKLLIMFELSGVVLFRQSYIRREFLVPVLLFPYVYLCVLMMAN